MTKEDEIKNEVVAAEIPSEVDAPIPVSAADAIAEEIPVKSAAPALLGKNDARGGRSGGRGGRSGGRGGRRQSFERVKPEFDQKMIDIRRVTRVTSGGRRFSFSVAVVIGDRKGSVGVGTGKAGDTSLAIEKAVRDAKKNILKLALNKGMSIPHETRAKSSSGDILLKPNKGKGLVVGSSARIVLDLAGVKDVSAKVLSGSKNKLNIARATIKALSRLSAPRSRKETESKEEIKKEA